MFIYTLSLAVLLCLYLSMLMTNYCLSHTLCRHWRSGPQPADVFRGENGVTCCCT